MGITARGFTAHGMMRYVFGMLAITGALSCRPASTPPPADESPDSQRRDAAIMRRPDEIAADAALLDSAAEGSARGSSLGAHVLYPEDRVHSPITTDVLAQLGTSSVAAPADDHIFAKVGDSITASESFLACFDRTGASARHVTSFRRQSLAARGGWTTADVLVGSPSPLERELADTSPRYAVVLLGTNDVRYGRTPDAYGSDLWTIIDRLRAHGTIPILSTLPAQHNDRAANGRLPLFNRVIRGIAQGRNIPLVDLSLALASLPNEGIGADGLHLTVAPQGACMLTEAGLKYGYNMRNLLTLEALERARRAVGGDAPDADAPRRLGAGTYADPYRGTLPLVDMADTRKGELKFGVYATCRIAATGHELVYRLDMPARITIEAAVVDHDGVDVDVAILAGDPTPASCAAAGDHSASAVVGPGPVYIVVDSRTIWNEGEFVLVVQQH